jgi:hypothetical protein
MVGFAPFRIKQKPRRAWTGLLVFFSTTEDYDASVLQRKPKDI